VGRAGILCVCLLSSILSCSSEQAASKAIQSYQALVQLPEAKLTEPGVVDAASRTARELGYVIAPQLGSLYVLPRGRARLMTYSEQVCDSTDAGKCREPSAQSHSILIFLEKENATGRYEMRVMRWCLSSCQDQVTRIANDFKNGIARIALREDWSDKP
jgi:hypothetical protein